MAEQDTGAVIVFEDGHTLHTRTTRAEIVASLHGEVTPHVPMIEVELPTGVEATVNAAQIRLIMEPPSPESYRIEPG